MFGVAIVVNLMFVCIFGMLAWLGWSAPLLSFGVLFGGLTFLVGWMGRCVRCPRCGVSAFAFGSSTRPDLRSRFCLEPSALAAVET